MSWQFSSLRNYLVNPDGESDGFTKLSKPPSTSGKSSANSFGLLVNMRALESLEKTLDEVYEQIHIPEERLSSGENSLIVNILSPIRYRSENDLIKTLKIKLHENERGLSKLKVNRITFAFIAANAPAVKFYSFDGTTYDEIPQMRNMDPSYEAPLELGKMSNYKIRSLPTYDSSIRIFEGISKFTPLDKRFFVRKIINSFMYNDQKTTEENLKAEINAQVVYMLEHLGAVDISNSDLNHIFFKFQYSS